MSLWDSVSGYMREPAKKKFAKDLMRYAHESISFKLSARGWCYQLEGMNVIDKGQFDHIQDVINNDLRKSGLLPWDFTASDEAREAKHVGLGDHGDGDPSEYVRNQVDALNRMEHWYDPIFWDTQDTYIEVWVEKVDLVTLFKSVCRKYKVPIANTRGWYSINMRGRTAKRFKQKQLEGKDVKLLYFGDFDPKGVQISNVLVKNFSDLEPSTGFEMSEDMIDRFGLNYEIIKEYDLTWIDNLKSSSGKKPDKSKKLYVDWISKYGERKVEANAIIPQPDLAEKIMENAIKKHLGPNPLKEYEQIKKERVDQIRDIKEKISLEDVITALEERIEI